MCATLYSNVCHTRFISEEVRFYSMFRSANGCLKFDRVSHIKISLGVIQFYKALRVWDNSNLASYCARVAQQLKGACHCGIMICSRGIHS